MKNPRTQTILAIFATPDEAVATAWALRREGIARVDVMSAEPIHDAIPDEETRSYIGQFAVMGAVIGAGFAAVLTVWTSQRVGIVTGGMPIVTPWAFGIIGFELAMLGAILAALVRMLFEARLARPLARNAYDEAVADNKIVLAVYCAGENLLSAAEKLLAETSAEVRKKD